MKMNKWLSHFMFVVCLGVAIITKNVVAAVAALGIASFNLGIVVGEKNR